VAEENAFINQQCEKVKEISSTQQKEHSKAGTGIWLPFPKRQE
jgi:hypothetical protein